LLSTLFWLLDYIAPHIKYFIGVIFNEFTTTSNWMERKYGWMGGIEWNGFHHTPFHYIHVLQNQTMEHGSITLNFIPFHHPPSIQT